MERKLASIQKIIKLEPIENADSIEKATILGWSLVVKKGEFNEGDYCVYCEVDSILPDKPEFEFLKDKKFRIKTIKLRGQISQGIAFPLSILPNKKWNENDDVTKILNIKKYDPQGELEAKLLKDIENRKQNKIFKFMKRYSWYRKLFLLHSNKGEFPKFIPKTDEDRIQLFPNICEREKDTIFTFTEKLDGQSGTWFLIKKKTLFGKKYIFGVCSRRIHLSKLDNSSYWTIAKQYDLKNKLEVLIGKYDYVALQGEIIGEGIQKNKYNIKGYDVYFFNLIYPDKKIISFGQYGGVLSQLGLKRVPFLEYSKLKSTIPEMVEYAHGKSIISDIYREGIVCRNQEKQISFKVINTDFLLKYGE
jgi:hypothetical protein